MHYRDEGIAKAARHGWARALQRAVWLFEDRIVRRGIGGRTRKLVAAADLATESKNRQFANRYEATPTPLLLIAPALENSVPNQKVLPASVYGTISGGVRRNWI